MPPLACSSLLTLALLFSLAPAIAAAEPEKPDPATTTAITLDQIVQRHIAAHGGEQALSAGQTFWFTVARDWEGEVTMKTVYQTRPNMTRTDGHTAKGSLSFGYDGALVWRKRGIGPASIASPEETRQIKAHMEFDGWELVAGPLFAPLRLPKAAKEATSVKLLGRHDEAGRPAWVLELKHATGTVERYFVDAKSFLLLRRDELHEHDGKKVHDSYRYGDYKDVAGRMFNHSYEFAADGVVTGKSVVSNIAFDKPIDATAYAMPK